VTDGGSDFRRYAEAALDVVIEPKYKQFAAERNPT